jgi:hypothetical protein
VSGLPETVEQSFEAVAKKHEREILAAGLREIEELLADRSGQILGWTRFHATIASR